MLDLTALVWIRQPEGMRVMVVLAQVMPGKQGGQSIGAKQALGAAHRGSAQGLADAYRVFDDLILAPILDPQTAYTAELAFVGGDEHEPARERAPGNQRIVGADRTPFLLERRP